MATQKDYQTGVDAANAWLQRNAGMYAGMIPQSYIQAITKSVIDAVDAERNGQPKPQLHPLPAGQVGVASSSVLIEFVLGMIPWQNMADKDAMREEIPTAADLLQQVGAIAHAYPTALKKIVDDWHQCGPAVMAAAKAIASMEQPSA